MRLQVCHFFHIFRQIWFYAQCKRKYCKQYYAFLAIWPTVYLLPLKKICDKEKMPFSAENLNPTPLSTLIESGLWAFQLAERLTLNVKWVAPSAIQLNNKTKEIVQKERCALWWKLPDKYSRRFVLRPFSSTACLFSPIRNLETREEGICIVIRRIFESDFTPKENSGN